MKAREEGRAGGIFLPWFDHSEDGVTSLMSGCQTIQGGGGGQRTGPEPGIFLGLFLLRSPNPRFLHGTFPVGDMDQPLFSWGYGFRLGIWTGPFPVKDTHPQKPVLSCPAPKGPISILYDTFHGLHAHQFQQWHCCCPLLLLICLDS